MRGWPYPKSNEAATAAPTITDDIGSGYEVGSVWVDTVHSAIYQCVSNARGAAVWVAGGGTGGAMSAGTMWLYKAKTTATSGYPGDGYMLWDNATQISATSLIFAHLTTDNLDIDIVLGTLAAGQTIILQDSNNSDNYQKWTVASGPTNTNGGTATSYWTVPVTLVASAGTGTAGFSNNHQLVVFAIRNLSGNVGPAGPPGMDGYSGEDGLTIPGPVGAVGPQGPAGADGTIGAVGPPGMSGDDGINGLDGIPGPPGPTGATGPQGPAGSAGGTNGYENFAGTNTYGSGDTNTPHLVSTWTFAVWVYFRAVSATYGIYSRWQSTSTAREIYIYVTGGKIQVDIPFISAIMTSVSSLTTNIWHHIAVTRNGSSWKLYIDGTQDQTATNANASETGVAPDIGRDTGGGTPTSYLNGFMASIGIWNVDLGSSDITSLANGANPVNVQNASLVYLVPITGNGNIEKDIIGSKNVTMHNATPTAGPF